MAEKTMAQAETLVPVDDLWEGEMRVVDVQGASVLLVNVAGNVVACEDRCPHKGVPLSRGTLINGRILTCSAHQWVFDVAQGRGVNPATAYLKLYNVRRIGERGLAISQRDEGAGDAR